MIYLLFLMNITSLTEILSSFVVFSVNARSENTQAARNNEVWGLGKSHRPKTEGVVVSFERKEWRHFIERLDMPS